jgi:hypothetical protein
MLIQCALGTLPPLHVHPLIHFMNIFFSPLWPIIQPLPDALRGEKWAFVQLPLGTVLEMLKKVEAVRAAF